MNIRLATKEDIELIASIRTKAILAQPASFWSAEYLEKVANVFDAKHFENEISNEIPASKIYIFEDCAFVGHKADYLAYLFVLPQHQNRQIGAKLLNFIEDKMRTENVAQTWLLAHPYAENFYIRNGYVANGEVQRPFGQDLKKMVKQLA